MVYRVSSKQLYCTTTGIALLTIPAELAEAWLQANGYRGVKLKKRPKRNYLIVPTYKNSVKH